MGTYGYDGVFSAWKTGKLSAEQAIGQILQLIQEMERRLRDMEQRMIVLENAAQAASKPASTVVVKKLAPKVSDDEA